MTAPQSAPGPLTDAQGIPALRIAGLAKSFGETAAVSQRRLPPQPGSPGMAA